MATRHHPNSERKHPLDYILRAILRRIRPSLAQQQVPPKVLVGWALRVGLLPIIRGTLRSPPFGHIRFPFFLGNNVTLRYRSQITSGPGFYLGANSFVNAFSAEGIQIGRRVTIREGAWVQCSSSPGNPGEGLAIGDAVYIGPQAILGIGGPITIGSRTQAGVGLVLISENHDGLMSNDGTVQVVRKGIHIGEDVWIGHRVTILDGVTLGDGCIVGAGAVVTKSFPAGATIAGIPARQLEHK